MSNSHISLGGGGTFARKQFVLLKGLGLKGLGLLAVVALVCLLAGQAFAQSGVFNGSLTLGSGDVLFPGGDGVIGTFTVNGDMTFERDSIYRYDFRVGIGSGINEHDLLIVQPGSFITIQNGAQLEINDPLSGTPVPGTSFQVIETDHSEFQGGYFTHTGTWGWRFRPEIRDDGYWISLMGLADSVRPFATPNATRVAESVGASVELDTRLNFIHDPHVLADALGQLHGEVFASNQEAAARQQRRFQQLMPNGRELFSQTTMPTLCNRWGTFTGDWRRRGGIEQYSAYDFSSTGFAVGIDRAITQTFLLGVALGYDHGWQDFKSIRSRSRVEAFRTMIYGSFYSGNYFLDAYGGYTKNCHHTKRHIDIDSLSAAPFSATARSRYNDDMASVGLEFGRIFQLGNTILTPHIGIHSIILNSPNVTETGGDFANLHAEKNKFRSLNLPIGIRANKNFVGKYGVLWMPEIRAAFVREFADDSARVRTWFADTPNAPFYAESGRWGLHSGRVGGGIGTLISNRLTFRFDYDYEIYSRMSVHTCGATLGLQW